MKLKISTTNIDALRNTLSVILSLRKFCVLRFTRTHLHIISAALNEPQVWCKLSKDLFDIYEVESIRDNTIAMEINIEPLFQALKNYERANSDGLSIRLQKKTAGDNANGSGNSGSGTSKLLLTLALFYNEHLSATSTVSHTFRIPIRLLKRESDERIVEPSLVKIDLFMTLRREIVPLFKRIDRYKKSEYLNISATKNGYLGLTIREDLRAVTISWRGRLELMTQDGEGTSSRGDDEPVNVVVKLKDWKVGARLCELSEKVAFVMGEMELLVLHCNLDEEDKCEIVYFMANINVNGV